MWGPILEKAFAKYHGNYAHMSGGWPTKALATLAGSPSFQFGHSGAQTAEENDTMWERLMTNDSAGEMIQSATPCDSTKFPDNQGIVYCHAYTVLGV